MAYLAQARKIAPADFARDFASKDWGKATWSPKMFVLHNTGAPTLAQWLGPTPPERRMGALRAYYQGMGWHSAPHWFVAPDAIWEFCDPLQDGVHCSCANHVAFGCEMIGDYGSESFDTGSGAQVRDNAVTLVASVFKHFGWRPDPFEPWERGLAFHKNCSHDHHDCPGRNVDRSDFVRRVYAAMGTPIGLDAGTPAAATQVHAPIASTVPDGPAGIKWAQNALNQLGTEPPLAVDGMAGPMTKAALYAWQAGANLAANGQLSPVTIAALQKALTA